MIRQADQNTAARGAIALDLGDLFQQGEAIKRAARDQADAMLASARGERDRLVSGGAAAGHAQGLARGLGEGRAQGLAEGKAQAAAEHAAALGALEKSWSDALASFEARRDLLFTEARQEVLSLALSIAARVTHRVVRADASVVADQMSAVLALVARPTRLVIAVSPDDLVRAGEALPDLVGRFRNAAHVEVVADPSLAAGSCIARAEGGAEIDASIDTQLERIAEALVPGRAAPRLALAGSQAESSGSEAA